MATCPICVQHGWDHDAIVESCKKSIFETGVVLCKFERLIDSPIHKHVFDQVQEWIEAGEHNILVMLPRDFLKTTMLACISVWAWLNDPEKRIYLFHASSRQSSKLIPVIQRIVMDSPMKHFFPQLIPDTKTMPWNSECVSVNRAGNYASASLESKGVGSVVTGGHCTWMFHDDLVEQGAANSDAEIRAVMNFFRSTPALFDDPEQELSIVVGTLWEGGFYEELQQEGIYKSIILGAECDQRFREFMAGRSVTISLEDGEPIWPEFFPTKVLERRLRQMGEINYARQYLNQPAENVEMTFKREQIRFCSLVQKNDGTPCVHFVRNRIDHLTGQPTEQQYILPLRQGVLTATCDPATGEKRTSDDSALNVSVHWPEHGIAVVLEEWSQNALPAALIDQIFRMMQRWKPYGLTRLGIEQAGYQVTLKRWLESEMQRRKFFFTVDMIPTKNLAKPARIRDGLQPWIANYRVYFVKSCAALVKQLLNIRIVGGNLVGRSPNRVDALAMQAQKYWRSLTDDYDELSTEGTPLDNEPYTDTKRYGLGCIT